VKKGLFWGLVLLLIICVITTSWAGVSRIQAVKKGSGQIQRTAEQAATVNTGAMRWNGSEFVLDPNYYHTEYLDLATGQPLVEFSTFTFDSAGGVSCDFSNVWTQNYQNQVDAYNQYVTDYNNWVTSREAVLSQNATAIENAVNDIIASSPELTEEEKATIQERIAGYISQGDSAGLSNYITGDTANGGLGLKATPNVLLETASAISEIGPPPQEVTPPPPPFIGSSYSANEVRTEIEGGITVIRRAYTYSIAENYIRSGYTTPGSYTYQAVEYEVNLPDGSAVILKSRGSGNGTSGGYFNVYFNSADSQDVYAMRGDPVWFKYEGAGEGAEGVRTAINIAENVNSATGHYGELPSVGDYYMDYRGGALHGGASLEMITGSINAKTTNLGSTFATQFKIQLSTPAGPKELVFTPAIIQETYTPGAVPTCCCMK